MVVSNNDLDNIVSDLDEDFLSSVDQSLLDLLQLFHDEWFVLFNDLHYDFFGLGSEFLGSSLNFFPDGFHLVFESISHLWIRLNELNVISSNDVDDLVADGDDNLLSSINNNLFDGLQSLDDSWLVFLDGFLHFSLDLVI